MGVITILKDFTFVGSVGQVMATDWISFPAEYKNAQLALVVKSAIAPANLACVLQGTFDMDSETTIAAPAALTAAGTSLTDVTTGLTPMIRLQLTAGGGAATSMVLSAYLTAKSE